MPAPAGLAWYGAVGTTAALGELLLKFLDDFASVQDNVKSLRLKVKDDLDLIEQFLTFMKDLSPGHVSVFDASLLNELAAYLQPLMIQCETKIGTIGVATADQNNVETYAASRLAMRTVEEIEKDLESWVQRLNARLSLMSEKLKLDAIRALGRRDPALQFQYEMQRLSSEIRVLHNQGQTVAYEDLWLPASQDLDLGDAPRRRRMNASLANHKVVVEFISYNAATMVEKAQETIGELAFILNRSDPSVFHILKCIHLYQEQSSSGRSPLYGLVFEMPLGLETIRDLSDIVADGKNTGTQVDEVGAARPLPQDVKKMQKIGSKSRIAYQLSVSLRYLHSFGYVHQTIRTSNILIGSSENVDRVEGYLSGFERSRPNAGASNQRRLDADWRNNIYRSPDRVANTDEETIKRHTMSHDIYSLGVVLLELGLFQPLTSMESKFKNKTAETARDNLEELAKEELPSRMGDTYAKVALYCLKSTLDSWLAAHVAEMGYVEQVLGPLEQLSKLT